MASKNGDKIGFWNAEGGVGVGRKFQSFRLMHNMQVNAQHAS